MYIRSKFTLCDNRGPGRPRTNWRSTVNKDLLRMGITWEEAEAAAQNRSEWRRNKIVADNDLS